jgi:hypothetical protein
VDVVDDDDDDDGRSNMVVEMIMTSPMIQTTIVIDVKERKQRLTHEATPRLPSVLLQLLFALLW